jgi:uncharacterized membrane protein
LSSEKVWSKTHHRAGQLFILSGVLGLLGIFIPRAAFFLAVCPIILTAVYLVVYSYVIYRRAA